MKPLYQYEPWKVVSVGFAVGVLFVLAGMAIGLLILARLGVR
jgi:hypothetical protein